MSRAVAFVSALALLTLVGCAEQGMVDDASGALGERRDFKSARSAGTTAAWTSFLERYPQSTFREKAQAGLNEALWHDAERTNTAGAYLAFTENNPSHAMAGESRDRCRKLLEQLKGSEGDVLNYLRDYPDDQDARQLRQALKTIRYNAVGRSDADAAALFAAQYPKTPEADKFSESAQARAYAEAEKTDSRLAYQFFLKRFPGSSLAAKAQSKLEQFVPAEVPPGRSSDLKLLTQLRKASPGLVLRECRRGLEARLAAASDLYDAESERNRGRLKELAGSPSSPPSYCAEQKYSIPASARQAVQNAVRALAVLAERQQYLSSVLEAPDKIAQSAEQTASQANEMADASESSELEIEALYGSMPADPKKPDESASNNGHEASRRAQRAAALVKGMSKRDEISEIAAAATRQSDLLVDVIAYLERPVVKAAAAPADDAGSEPAAEGAQ